MDPKRPQKSKVSSCWTCKDRKVRCDGYFPTCINCARAKRECIRSSVRLSWPKVKDKKRNMTSNLVPKFNVSEVLRDREAIFVNTSPWDITLQMELDEKGISPTHFNAWALEIPNQFSCIPPIAGAGGETLLSYFSSTMSYHLAPFGGNGEIIQLLLKVAFMDDTPASGAVLQGILALSALRLYGREVAFQFKTKAMSMLSCALKDGMDLSEFLRTLAASLLLSSYQIASSPDFSVNWTFFVCGAIKVAKAMSLPQSLDRDEILLFDWLSCHTILANFSLSHWLQTDSCVYRQRKPCSHDAQLSAVYSLIPDRSRILDVLGCSLDFLDILASICSAVLPQTDPGFLSKAHRRQLDSLELRLKSMHQYGDPVAFLEETTRRPERVAELYRLSGLIYLHRAGRRTRIDFSPTLTLIKQAFSILETLSSCEGLWPLFIVGCEARSDEQRLIIQDVFRKTLENRDIGNAKAIKMMIEKAWIQEDLVEYEEVDYLCKINALMSANQVLPTFI